MALQAAAFTGFSWSQLTIQQHLLSTFSLIKVQSQHSFSFSICIAQCPATSFYTKMSNYRAVVQRSSSSKDVSDHEAHPQQCTVTQLRDQAREPHIPHTGKKTALVDRIHRALRLARQQPQQQSPQPHRDTPPAPRISADCSVVDRESYSHSTATDQRQSVWHCRTAPSSHLLPSATPTAGRHRRHLPAVADPQFSNCRARGNLRPTSCTI